MLENRTIVNFTAPTVMTIDFVLIVLIIRKVPYSQFDSIFGIRYGNMIIYIKKLLKRLDVYFSSKFKSKPVQATTRDMKINF